MPLHHAARRQKTRTQAWLDAVGTEHEAKETKNYIAELEEDIVTADGLVAFAESEAGAQVFGVEKAKEVAAHGKELVAQGKPYCELPCMCGCRSNSFKKR